MLADNRHPLFSSLSTKNVATAYCDFVCITVSNLPKNCTGFAVFYGYAFTFVCCNLISFILLKVFLSMTLIEDPVSTGIGKLYPPTVIFTLGVLFSDRDFVIPIAYIYSSSLLSLSC